MLPPPNKATEIATFIVNHRAGMTDQELHNLIESEFCDDLDFIMCADIDGQLYPTTERRIYWRAAYDFPLDGAVVHVPAGGGITAPVVVTNCGFFTFGILSA